MDALKSLLPHPTGVLPYWLLFLSAVSIGNCIQSYTTLHFTRRVFNGKFVKNNSLPRRSETFNPEDSVTKLVPTKNVNDSTAQDQVTPLAGRLFGVWTLLACVVRCYAAYYLHMAPVYDIAMCTYYIAFGLFGSELFYYKTMDFGLPQFFPFLVATSTIIWMPLVRSHYVEA